jgi:hypothetical protein
MMAFRKGAKMAEEQEAAKPKGGGFGGPKTQYLSIDPDDHVYVRFLMDVEDWLLIKEHTFLPPRDPNGLTETGGKLPQKSIDSWPKKSNATCRYDEGLVDEDGEKLYDDCYICDNMTTDKGKKMRPKDRMYALVCVRVPVVGTQEMVDAGRIPAKKLGKTLGFEDAYREVPKRDEDGKEIEGETEEILDIQIACFGWTNFWQPLSVLAEGTEDETLLDRDIRISRKGESLDTRYIPSPMDPIKFRGFEGDEEPRKYSLQDEDVRKHYWDAVWFDLEKIIADRASDDHYARFFDVTKPIPLREWEKDQADAPAEKKAKPARRSTTMVIDDDDDDEPQSTEAAQGGGPHAVDDADSEVEASYDQERAASISSRLRAGARREPADA